MSSTAPTQQSDAELDAAFTLEQTSKARANAKTTRPTSTMALAFSDALNDAFLIDDQLDQLSQTIDRKYVPLPILRRINYRKLTRNP